jgi:DHA1 family bicyclomycin/chloramphenicol resistance-like MFS transporter
VVLLLVAADQGETVRAKGEGLRAQVRSYPLLLRSRRFWGYSLCAMFASGAFFALLGGASFVAGRIFGLSPLWTGIALGAPSIGYVAGNFLAGRYSARVGVDRMALAGCLVAALGLFVSLGLTLLGFGGPGVFFGFCVFLGMGNGMTLPNAMAGSISVRPELAGTASGLSGAIMTAGGAALSVLAVGVLSEATGPWPVQAIMVGSAAMSALSLLLVRGTRGEG